MIRGIAVAGADAFAKVAHVGDVVVLLISRSEVDSGRVGDAIDRLTVLVDSAENVTRYEDRLLISFDGFDSDPREIFEIPECVAYFRKLCEHWPWWFHFVEKSGSTLALVLRLLCNGTVYRQANGQVDFEFHSVVHVQETVLSLFGSMNALYAQYGLSLEQNKAMTAKVIQSIQRMAA